MKLKLSLLATILLATSITACSEKIKQPLQGRRIDVLFNSDELHVDKSIARIKVELPKENLTPFWPQTYANSAHYPKNVKLAKKVKEAWSKSIGSGSDDDKKLLNPPIVGEKLVYTINTDGEIMARSTNKGKLVWKTKLETQEEDLLVFTGGLAVGKYLYVTAGSGDVVAYNPQTGKKVWQVNIGSPIRSAPALAEDKLFILTYDNHIYALSTKDGSLIWTHSSIEEGLAILGGATPAVSKGVVIVPYSSGEIYALRTSDGRYLWHDSLSLTVGGDPFSSLVDIEASPVIAGNVVYAVNHNGQLTSFHLGTGNRLWSQKISATQTPWVAGNMIYIVTENNTLVAMHRQRGQVKWITNLRKVLEVGLNKKLEGKISWAGPILAGNRLIVNSSNGFALSFSPQTGKALSAVKLPDDTDLAPVVADGTLYFLSTDGDLTAYR